MYEHIPCIKYGLGDSFLQGLLLWLGYGVRHIDWESAYNIFDMNISSFHLACWSWLDILSILP